MIETAGRMLRAACLLARMDSILILKEQILAAADSAYLQKIKQLFGSLTTALTGLTITDSASICPSSSFQG